MFKSLFFGALVLIINASCNEGSRRNSREKELEEKERELKNREALLRQNEEIKTKQIEIYQSKYVYAKFLIEIPILYHKDAEEIVISEGRVIEGSGLDMRVQPPIISKMPEINTVSFKEYIFNSDIIKVENLTEDKKYQILDEIEYSEVQIELNKANAKFERSLFPLNISKSEEIKSKNYTSKVKSRKLVVFDSYSEASKEKESNKPYF